MWEKNERAFELLNRVNEFSRSMAAAINLSRRREEKFATITTEIFHIIETVAKKRRELRNKNNVILFCL